MEYHIYQVEGTRSGQTHEGTWRVILRTCDPVEAMDCAHYAEGWFWRRVWEDDHLIIDRL